jgi:hypothetical protein
MVSGGCLRSLSDSSSRQLSVYRCVLHLAYKQPQAVIKKRMDLVWRLDSYLLLLFTIIITDFCFRKTPNQYVSFNADSGHIPVKTRSSGLQTTKTHSGGRSKQGGLSAVIFVFIKLWTSMYLLMLIFFEESYWCWFRSYIPVRARSFVLQTAKTRIEGRSKWQGWSSGRRSRLPLVCLANKSTNAFRKD